MITNLLVEFQMYIKPDTVCVLALSWWPDSMMILRLYNQLVQNYNYTTGNLHIFHAHHHIRLESDQEMKFVQQYTVWYMLHISHYDWFTSDENSLRKRRKRQCLAVAEKVGATHIITWHNLTDRIETTMMNMLRGCQLTWLINMKHISTIYKHIRYKPLLDQSKQDILEECNTQHIPYVIDSSNTDITVSKRNKIRHTIIQPLIDMSHNSDCLRHSWKILYKYLEQQSLLVTPQHHITIEWDIYILKRTNNRSDNDSVRLLQQIGIYYDISQAYIKQLTHICTTTNKKMISHWWTIHTDRNHIICQPILKHTAE